MGGGAEYRIRIGRWRDHNREHQHTLEEWSVKAREAGLTATADAMTRAADLLGRSVDELDIALQNLD